MDPTVPPLLAPELHTVLQHHVLPLLSVHDLGRLSCTCSPLRNSVAEVDIRLWRSGAAAVLPPAHPSLEAADLATVRRALLRCTGALRNLAAGRVTVQHQLPAAWNSWISPDGATLALLEVRIQTSRSGAKMVVGLALSLWHHGDAPNPPALLRMLDLGRHASQLQVAWPNSRQAVLTFFKHSHARSHTGGQFMYRVLDIATGAQV